MEKVKHLPVIEEVIVCNILSSTASNIAEKEKAPDQEESVVIDDKEEQRELMRAGFIVKVYGIIAIQLIITISCIGVVYIPGYISFILSKQGIALLYTAMTLGIIIAIILACIKGVARKVPYNYTLLIIFTLCESYLLQYICGAFEPLSVFISGLMTIAMVATLSIYALSTKANFTCFGAFFFSFLMNLLLGAIMIFFLPSRWLQIIYSALGVLLFSLYLICDVQMISGNFGNSFGIDDYILASMCIYLDIINLFVQILQLIGKRRR